MGRRTSRPDQVYDSLNRLNFQIPQERPKGGKKLRIGAL